ncbi:alkaline phosphatase family protein [Nonomuraea sp. NPDC049695]|uniref:alkaline phosphatase family protein n=1 Tax=Nonomuraea sp. NPDC049695 TaxID=3154734 RepID=UPI003427D074
MSRTVMTMGRTGVVALLHGRAPLHVDFREITFECHFSADAVNGGATPAPKPRIQVTVSTQARWFEVEIIPPGGQREVMERSSQGGRISWARPVVMEGGRPQVEPRWLARRAMGASDWEIDDPLGTVGGLSQHIDPTQPVGGGVGPGGGGGGGSAWTYTRLLDPATDESGRWTVRVHNLGDDDQDFSIAIDHPETVQELRETRIPFQLINRTFAQALLSMQLRIHIDSGQARIEFDRTFQELTGVESQIFSVTDALKDINLQEFKIWMGNEAGIPTIFASLDLEERGDEIGVPYWPDINVENLAITCRVQLKFDYPRGPNFFDTAMKRENAQILRKPILVSAFLDANPHINSLWASFADMILAISGALGITDASSIDEYVQAALEDAEDKLEFALQKAAPYFQDVIMNLVDREAVLFRISADDSAIVVSHHRRPSLRDFLNDHGGPIGNGTSTRPVADRVPASHSSVSLEALSARSTNVGPRNHPRLYEGKIDHIVVLMMENRSFDHMLGYRHFSHPEVHGLTGNESNPFSQGPPYDVHHLTATAGLRSPDHGFNATIEQIAEGAMSGFVENYSRRSVDPGLVMGYYEATELPMYEFLANNFAICDAWHSAHPGETQCNRFATLTGAVPELTNLELSDPRLGYYDDLTIFDYLSREGIDWVYAEGNVAFLRVFDKYRIDVSHVIPYQDDFNQGIEDTFVQRVQRGELPSVSFIDPRYIDVPPAWDANDDLPPADVCRGQQLVSHVYSLLSNAATWRKTLLLVTYDEHGGFFDHEAPHGMAASRVPTPFPPLHPDGPQHLGVRVPAFVVSPWIDGGKVLHTTYDHTSILKTILQRFAPADFPIADVFGPRAAAANGLLSEQLRTSARLQIPQEPHIECILRPTRLPAGPSAELDNRDFHLSMRLLGLPAKYRDRAAS